MSALVLVENLENLVKQQTYSVVTAMRSCHDRVDLLILASDAHAPEIARQAAAIEGVEKVIVMSAPYLQSQLTEDMAAQVSHALSNNHYTAFAMSSGFMGKKIVPYLAGKFDCDAGSDVIAFLDNERFIRPVYSGSLLTVEKLKSAIQFLTIRANAFLPAAKLATPNAPIEKLAAVPAVSRAARISTSSQNEENENTRNLRGTLKDLSRARVVIGFGAGVTKEDLPHIYQLAEKLNAALGATRSAIDAGMATTSMMLGQTGKTVAPDLYIAIGLSGAVQHTAGIKDSKTIVAINKDAHAPIFDIADYGWVADARVAIPKLVGAL